MTIHVIRVIHFHSLLAETPRPCPHELTIQVSSVSSSKSLFACTLKTPITAYNMDENDHTIVGGAALVTGSLFLAFAFITVLDVRYLFTATIPLVVVGIMLVVFGRRARSKADEDKGKFEPTMTLYKEMLTFEQRECSAEDARHSCGRESETETGEGEAGDEELDVQVKTRVEMSLLEALQCCEVPAR